MLCGDPVAGAGTPLPKAPRRPPCPRPWARVHTHSCPAVCRSREEGARLRPPEQLTEPRPQACCPSAQEPPSSSHAAGVMLGLRARVVSIAAPARSTRRPRLGEVGGPAQGHTPGGGVRPGSAHAVSRSPDDSASSGSGLGAGKADATLQPEASREPGHSHHVPPREAPLGTRDAALNGKWQPATGLGGRGCWSRGLVRGVTLGTALPSLA